MAEELEEIAALAVDAPGSAGAGSTGAGEVAWAVSELVPALPPDVAAGLKRLLAHSLASPTLGERREARLGLLVELVAAGEGEIPTTMEYEAERKNRQEVGEVWPSHTAIARAWGHWLKAVGGAMRLAFRPSGGAAPETTHHIPSAAPYTREEVLRAIRECREALVGRGRVDREHILLKSEYEEWSKLRRRGARLAGKPDPRLPTREPIGRFFGSFERAEDLARRS